VTRGRRGRESPALMLGELGAHAGLIGAGLLTLQDTGG
jgi:hypothetical protein